MTKLPLVAYMCPTCNGVSDTVHIVVTTERTTPYRYDYREKSHRPDLYAVKTFEGMSEWRCVLCGEAIPDIDKSLVDVFTAPRNPPDGIEIERDIDTSEVEPAAEDIEGDWA